jgi:hypothetical protein
VHHFAPDGAPFTGAGPDREGHVAATGAPEAGARDSSEDSTISQPTVATATPRTMNEMPTSKASPHPWLGGWLYSDSPGWTVGFQGPETTSASSGPGHGGIVAPIAVSESSPPARN